MRLLFTIIILIAEVECYESFSQYRYINRFIELNAGTMLPEVKAGFKVNPLNKVYLGLSYYFTQNEEAEYYYKAYSFDLDFHFVYNSETNRLGRFFIANRLFYETKREPNLKVYALYLYLDIGRYFYIFPNTGIKIEAGAGKLLEGRKDFNGSSFLSLSIPEFKMDVEISFFHRFGLRSGL